MWTTIHPGSRYMVYMNVSSLSNYLRCVVIIYVCGDTEG